MTKIITVPELEKHNHKDSCWVAFRGKVYDVTDFAEDHPGGHELIFQYGGKAIDEVLFDPIFHTHTEEAVEMLQELCVGQLVDIASDGCYTYTSAEIDFKTEKFLNLNEPLFEQMFFNNFTKEFYLEQVHKPRYTKDSPLLFGNPFLEMFTRTYWYVIPIFWTPISMYFAYNAWFDLDPQTFWVLLATSPLIFGLVEYLIHRFLFHLDDMLPDHPFFLFLHFTFHGVHHYLPMDRMRLVLPPVMALALAAPVIKIFFYVLEPPYANVTVSGFLIGYMAYDLMHYFLHHTPRVPIPEYFREMKRYHLAHHHQDYSLGFGITSKVWDNVFDTVLEVDETKL